MTLTFDLEIESIHLCPQLHLLFKFHEIPVHSFYKISRS